jgi:hypothetical protein
LKDIPDDVVQMVVSEIRDHKTEWGCVGNQDVLDDCLDQPFGADRMDQFKEGGVGSEVGIIIEELLLFRFERIC